MFSRSPNYYFETIFNRIEREIAKENPALILVNKPDFEVVLACIPKTQRTMTQKDASGRPYEIVVKDDDGVERTFRRVPPEHPPTGTLNLTETPAEEL